MKKPAKKNKTRNLPAETKSWNFVLFLTLALMLLVSVMAAINRTAQDLRIKARLDCPDVAKILPRPEDCPGGKWTYSRDPSGCPAFICE
jgi:hypothetical protein